ncbi:gfo/Idh/MocA family oxidoreductase [candidate division KSB1 bacterium]|nr:MAG: gfo/Idh/MocA family oxidoreductase [candidate division KSB1 bacterium]
MKRLRIGIIGLGHLGIAHLKNAKEIDNVEIAGINDINIDKARKLSEEYGVPYYQKPDDLIKNVDCISIVTPTIEHYKLAKHSLLCRKHIFIEKPITSTTSEADELIEIANNYNLKIQVGHIERFNPAFKAISKLKPAPMFIEAHRLASFVPRGTDVSVILDIMIHDIDIILKLVPSEIENIEASGVKVITDNIDIANARIKFKNKAVANITASRISQRKMRKMRLFQKSSYISINFLEKSAEYFKLIKNNEYQKDNKETIIDYPGKNKKVLYYKLQPPDEDALKSELNSFIQSILNDTTPEVSGEEGRNALDIALKILDKINE